MDVYVLGAGVSKTVDYPVGTQLFDEIDRYVRESGPLIDRFDYRKDWDALHTWLANNSNPMIAQAYYTKNIEHLFTVLDFATEQRDQALMSIVRAARTTTSERTAQSKAFDAFDEKIKEYQDHRRTLLRALEHYFVWRHHESPNLRGD